MHILPYMDPMGINMHCLVLVSYTHRCTVFFSVMLPRFGDGFFHIEVLATHELNQAVCFLINRNPP